jgi:hypothetical protein
MRAHLGRRINRARHLAALLSLVLAACGETQEPTLVGLAMLPADHFVTGPASGQLIDPANGRTPPFDGQPVQGFSALIENGDGSFLALPDNGYGRKENSADFLLRVYELRPDFKIADGGAGTIGAESVFLLRDPDRVISFPIVADLEFYPGSPIPVDPEIRNGRLLTGADFDVESFRRVADGTFYFGDEFGPFLLHTDSTGRLLEPPIELPGVRSPQHPLLGAEQPNARASGGFEGMALSADGTTLYPMLERPLVGQEEQLNIYAFDLAAGTFTHSDPYEPRFKYQMDAAGVGVPEITAVDESRFLIIERDGGQGPTARHKKVFLVDLGEVNAEGFLIKTEVIDLLDVADPHDVSASGTGRFTFPYETTEALVILEDGVVGIINDNNYPFGLGRHTATGQPDDNEFILVRIRPLP